MPRQVLWRTLTSSNCKSISPNCKSSTSRLTPISLILQWIRRTWNRIYRRSWYASFAKNYDRYHASSLPRHPHGTDTMAYIVFRGWFMLEGLDKPVILTGSQLPIGVLRTDGKENLMTSIEIAVAQNKGREGARTGSVHLL